MFLCDDVCWEKVGENRDLAGGHADEDLKERIGVDVGGSASSVVDVDLWCRWQQVLGEDDVGHRC